MLTKILFATDLSEQSKAIEEYLIKHNNNVVKELVILNVIDQKLIDALGHYDQKHNFIEAVKKDRIEKMEELADVMKKYGYTVKVIIREGYPASEILRAEKEENVEMIIVASHGKNSSQGFLIGSVSEKVVRNCKKPVLVFKG